MPLRPDWKTYAPERWLPIGINWKTTHGPESAVPLARRWGLAIVSMLRVVWQDAGSGARRQETSTSAKFAREA
jgi:hypothetical protein